MDIQISSNFERYLFELFDRDGTVLAETMAQFRAEGRLAVDGARLERAQADFVATRLDDDETVATMRSLFASTGSLIDPHTAIGVAAGRTHASDDGRPRLAVATAHPAKFPDAVARATGERPSLPDRLADLFDRPEHATALPADLGTVQRFIEGILKDRGQLA